MNWQDRIVTTISPGTHLVPHIDALFAQQRESWETFRQGEAALATVRSTLLACRGADVVVQANPGRRRSTHAQVDRQSIARRACFLCTGNLPAEERGIGVGQLVILPNPYPVLPRHCTIPSREHRPQCLQGQIGTLLDLARDLGPEMVAFYNGPRCGASAPDHFHFQGCQAHGIPLLDQLSGCAASPPWRPYSSCGRRLFAFVGNDRDRVRHDIERTVAELARETMPRRENCGDEPMVNLLVLFHAGKYTALLFPRAAHRPACYHADQPQRIAVSPATLEMAGVVVVAEPDHYDRVTAAVVQAIYEEVSLNELVFSQVVQGLQQ